MSEPVDIATLRRAVARGSHGAMDEHEVLGISFGEWMRSPVAYSHQARALMQPFEAAGLVAVKICAAREPPIWWVLTDAGKAAIEAEAARCPS